MQLPGLHALHGVVGFCCCLRNLPQSYLNVVGAIYFMNMAFSNLAGPPSLLCFVNSGVLQGCPLSGSLFAISVEPVLPMISTLLITFPGSIVRAFADDIGAVLASARLLQPLHGLFRSVALATGLAVKAKKCAIIP